MNPQETLPPVDVTTATFVPPTPEDLAGFSFPDLPSDPKSGTEVVTTPDNNATPVAPTNTPPEPAKSTETPAPAVDTKVTLPARADGESDLQYNLRMELFNAGQAKAAAETPEEKSILAQQIKGIREAMKQASVKEVTAPETTPKVPEAAPTQPLVSPTEEEIAKAQLRKLGFLTEEDYAAREAQRVNEAKAIELAVAADDFYASRPDIAGNKENKEAFEKFIVDTYLSKMDMTKLTKKDFAILLESTAKFAFPKANVVARADAAQDKVDLVNFSGSSKTEQAGGAGLDKGTRERLKASGWSDSQLDGFNFK